MGLLANWLTLDRPAYLAGTRVTLRAPISGDFESWTELRRKSRSFLEPWEPTWDEREFTRLSFRERVRRAQQLSDEDSAYTFFIFNHQGQLAGGITLSNVRRGVAQMGSLGYWIGEPFQRRGYMKEAVELLSQHAIADLGLHRIEAACLPHNTASILLLQSCKFHQEGLARGYLKIAGEWEDHLLFARLAGEQ
jgi:ribosomal-protein-alanine N-acetyltransferase